MTSQPDKLFRDTLENFQRPAPAGAWDKIEKNIAKPNYKIVWLRVAAGIALLTAAAVMLWPSQTEEQRITKAQDKADTKKNEVVQAPIAKATPEKKAEAEPSHNTYTAKTKVMSNKKEVLKKEEESVQHEEDTPVVSEAPQTNTLVAELITPEEKQETSKTLVYTSAEVNAKFLKKKLSPEATPESKEASGIQKLIGLAFAAKNSEAGLGDLRQKKDDLFALSFGKKKGEN